MVKDSIGSRGFASSILFINMLSFYAENPMYLFNEPDLGLLRLTLHLFFFSNLHLFFFPFLLSTLIKPIRDMLDLSLSMDETTDKGLEVKGSDAANRESRDIGRILVSGYDTGLPHDDVESALRKLYSSCGEITDVYIPIVLNSLWKSAFIYFVGEGAVDKAMQLNGSDMGGWTVDAEAFPFQEEDNNCVQLEVRGYDTTLSKSDIQCELSKLFSSCGKIDYSIIGKWFSLVFLVGEDAAEKAPKLSGSDMGGHKVVVRLVSYLGKTTVHRRRHKGHSICGRSDKKAKMTLE